MPSAMRTLRHSRWASFSALVPGVRDCRRPVIHNSANEDSVIAGPEEVRLAVVDAAWAKLFIQVIAYGVYEEMGLSSEDQPGTIELVLCRRRPKPVQQCAD